jgi:hypothetical protein
MIGHNTAWVFKGDKAPKTVWYRYKESDLEISKKVIDHNDDYSSSIMNCPLYRGRKKVGELYHHREHKVNGDGTSFTVGTSTIKLANSTIMYGMAFDAESHVHETTHTSLAHCVLGALSGVPISVIDIPPSVVKSMKIVPSPPRGKKWRLSFAR